MYQDLKKSDRAKIRKEQKEIVNEISKKEQVVFIKQKGGYCRQRIRQCVPGGWIVSDIVMDAGDNMTTATLFFPDLNHEWEI